MSYTLHNRLGSAGLAVEATLTWAGIDFELDEIESRAGSPLPDSFRATNPWGQVPALRLPNGDILTESAAIMIYLASEHPETNIGPAPDAPEYAAFLRWIIFSATNAHEAVSRYVYPFRFTTDESGHDGVSEAAHQRMRNSLLLLNETAGNGPFLLGKQMTGLDIYVAMFYAWCKRKSGMDRLEAIHSAVRDEPSIALIWKRHITDRMP